MKTLWEIEIFRLKMGNRNILMLKKADLYGEALLTYFEPAAIINGVSYTAEIILISVFVFFFQWGRLH